MSVTISRGSQVVSAVLSDTAVSVTNDVGVTVSNTINAIIADNVGSWNVSTNNAVALTDTILVAAPGIGSSLYLTDFIISNGPTSGSAKLISTGAGVDLDIAELMYFGINGGAVATFTTPIKLGTNCALSTTSVDVTNHSITVNGYTSLG